MNKLIAAICFVVLAVPAAYAQEKGNSTEKKAPSEAQKQQQDRMKACNDKAAAKNVKGDERKSFMSACLKG